MMVILTVIFLSAHCELTLALFRKHIHINQAMTWTNAQQYCRNHYEDLSTIDSLEEIERFLNDTADHMNTEGWAGLNKISTNTWQWSDGSEVSFLNWRTGEPNTPLTAHCGKVRNGHLYDYICDQQYTFFCYKWEPELVLVNQNKTWEEALEHCRSHHTDLASLPTKLHLFQASKKIANSQTASVWTGLRFMAGSWFWLSGDSLDNLVQLPLCPANQLNCGSRNLGANHWENRGCLEKLNFFCY